MCAVIAAIICVRDCIVVVQTEVFLPRKKQLRRDKEVVSIDRRTKEVLYIIKCCAVAYNVDASSSGNVGNLLPRRWSECVNSSRGRGRRVILNEAVPSKIGNPATCRDFDEIETFDATALSLLILHLDLYAATIAFCENGHRNYFLCR
jgi:hypothetical protein